MFTKNTSLAITVEYHAPYWIILLRNEGHAKFEPFRTNDKKVRVYNEYGDELFSRPAIKTFGTHQEALTYVEQHFASATKAIRSDRPGLFRSNGEIPSSRHPAVLAITS